MGSIEPYETNKGRRYRVLYRRPDHLQTQKRGFRTKRAAELFLAGIEIDKSLGTYVDPSAARATVTELGFKWLSSQTHLKPSSFRPVEIAWRVHVQPVWGGRPIGEIRHSEVQSWVSRISATSSATTVIRAYGVLAGILDVAVKDRRLPINPARGVHLPRKARKRRAYLNHTQVQLLADEARERSTLVLFLAYTGLRWGEAIGLRVGFVDTAKRRVFVTENAVQVARKIHVGTPKTHVTRSVPYPGFLDAALRAQLEGKTADDLVFGNGSDYLMRPRTGGGWLAGAVARAQATDPTFPRITIHDLRHTAASLAISAGANVKAVQRMLGHASAAMTLDTYADVFDDDLDAVAAALDRAKASAPVAKVLPKHVAPTKRGLETPGKSRQKGPTKQCRQWGSNPHVLSDKAF